MEKIYAEAKLCDIGEKGEKLFIASDSTVDRHGEVINVNGWDLDDYKKMPVILWGHDSSYPAIGKAKYIGFKTVSGDKKLVFEPEFHRKDNLSRLVADLIDEGYLGASSVGFLPVEMDNEADATYKKAKLLEISFVNVGSNPNALQMAFSKGYTTSDTSIVIQMTEQEKSLYERLEVEKEAKNKLEKELIELKQKAVPLEQKTGGDGRLAVRNEAQKKAIKMRTALKVVNKSIELLNKTLREEK